MATERRNDHRDLLLWRKALELTIDVPEGTARRTTKEFISFLHIARGWLAELDTQLLLAQRFGYLTEAETNNLVSQVNEVGRLFNAVIAGLRRRLDRRPALSPIP